MKILWDRLKKPGVDPLSPENPLIFMPGPFSGFPVPSASRTCVVTKSPMTSPFKSDYPHASTVSYSNMGGFFGPEIRFAGYDGIVITGKAASSALSLSTTARWKSAMPKSSRACGRMPLTRQSWPNLATGDSRPLHRTGRGKSRPVFQHPSYLGAGRRPGWCRLRHGFQEPEGYRGAGVRAAGRCRP